MMPSMSRSGAEAPTPEVRGIPGSASRPAVRAGDDPGSRISVAQAKSIQERLRSLVSRARALKPEEIRLVAGTDLSYSTDRKLALAAVVVMEYRTLRVVEERVAAREVTFPYVPGLLSFRELPALLEALGSLENAPDVIIADGQGLAHPRFFGLACHLGVETGIPTIGCAKSRLVGEHREPGPETGDWAPLIYEGETVGAVLRTKKGTKPIYVSIGHRVDLEFCVRVVTDCLRGYRLPEPQRRAHLLAEASKRHMARGGTGRAGP